VDSRLIIRGSNVPLLGNFLVDELRLDWWEECNGSDWLAVGRHLTKKKLTPPRNNTVFNCGATALERNCVQANLLQANFCTEKKLNVKR